MAAYSVTQTPELITATQLAAFLGRKSVTTVYRLMQQDPTFPRQIRVGGPFSVAWRRSEVMAWINAQKPVQPTGLTGKELRQRAKAAA